MSKASRSPDSGTFQKKNYILRSLEQGKSLDDPEVAEMIKCYESWEKLDEDRLVDTEWQKNNLEWDLRTTDWILEKVRASDVYAQNLYAALCNNDFVKTDNVFKILKEEYWTCSWRSAGGIIANMRCQGDYIDWYCSGIKNISYDLDPCSNDTTEDNSTKDYVNEGFLTDEIVEDLKKLGWIVILNKEIK